MFIRKQFRVKLMVVSSIFIAFILTRTLIFTGHSGSSSKTNAISDDIRKVTESNLDMNDMRLIQAIHSISVRPSTGPYYLSDEMKMDVYSSIIASKGEPWIDVLIIIDKLLPKNSQRYFLECGANDGETSSTTLHLEMHLNWSGILVEADPFYFQRLRTKNRRSILVEACASPESVSSVKHFQHAPELHELDLGGWILKYLNPGRGHLVGVREDITEKTPGWYNIEVPCFPLYSVMIANNMTKFDLIILDAEGSELGILNSLPFEKIDVKVFLIEMIEIKHRSGIFSLLANKNYTFHMYYNGNMNPKDGLFIRNDIYDKEKIEQIDNVLQTYKALSGTSTKDLTSKQLNQFIRTLAETGEDNGSWA